MDWKIMFFTLALVVWGLGHLVEYYKKTIRKNKAGKREVRAIALLLSAAATAVLYFLGFLIIPPDLAAITRWAIVAGYGCLIYYVQLKIDMKVVKKLGSYAIEEKLKDLGITPEQLARMKEASFG
ncbi:MAG: hypothetical protein CVV52_00405 [Spirochaetae bacterium HGW-Spirochaetae-8]|jgi:hypothetical protein|nr:MAG: hypothetical protein CVV52_00405 [Spirochaetae bacterium HGW-Spirochaetae-8]